MERTLRSSSCGGSGQGAALGACEGSIVSFCREVCGGTGSHGSRCPLKISPEVPEGLSRQWEDRPQGPQFPLGVMTPLSRVAVTLNEQESVGVLRKVLLPGLGSEPPEMVAATDSG